MKTVKLWTLTEVIKKEWKHEVWSTMGWFVSAKLLKHKIQKKINEKRLKTLDICFSAMFTCHDQSLISGRKIGSYALPSTTFVIYYNV